MTPAVAGTAPVMPAVTAQDEAALQAELPPPPLDDARVRALGLKLSSDFNSYEKDRRNAELQWAKNLRQFRGIYDPDLETALTKDRSRAYPKLTRVKCVSMVSRLMNLLFPSNEKNWAVNASPVPNLSQVDLQSVLDKIQQDPQADISDEAITAAVKEFARGRAKNLEIEIDDQLTELGGARIVDYVALCRRVLMSGIMYGAGVLKGPFARTRQQRRWQLDPETHKVNPVTTEVLVPQFEFVPLWDYYPDMSAKYLHQMDGQFQRIVMSRSQTRMLADNPDFMRPAIKKYLKDHQQGNYKQKQFESEIRQMGVHQNAPVNDGRKYEIIVWDGGLSGHYLKGCGIDVPEDKLSEMMKVIVWMIEDTVIRVTLSAWEMLQEDEPISTYHHFIFEEDESNLLGNGLPLIMRDSALGMAATARMILDNSGVICGPQLEINKSLLLPEMDIDSVHSYKIWYRDDTSPATVGVRAVNAINIESHVDELMKVNQMFRDFADQETFVNPANGGDMQKGPSEPFRTAAGASMIQGVAALPFKDVVRNFDMFTESVISSLVLFNKHFNKKPSIQGDFQAVARGSSSLIAKEVRGMGYDALATSLRPEEALYIDWRGLLRERLAVRDIDIDSVMVNDAEADRREKAQAAQQQKTQEQQDKLAEATVRKVLAEAVKNLTQGDKNTTAAQTVIYNAILAGLEKGATPSEIAEIRAGDDNIPKGVTDTHKILHPKPQPAKAAA